MSGSNRRSTSWIFCFLILVSAAVNAQVAGFDRLRGYYIITITPGDDPRNRLHFDSCKNLNEISPMAQFAYPAGIAGFRYMLCTIRSEQVASSLGWGMFNQPGVRPLTQADLAKLGLHGGLPQPPCENCVWTPPTNFAPETGPGEDDGLLVAKAVDFFYGRYGKDNVSVESKDVEHGHVVVTVSNLRDNILQRLGLWEWLQVNVMFGRRGDQHFFEMNAEGRYASGAGPKPPPSTAFAGMDPQYHEQLQEYALRLSVQLHDYLSKSGK